MRRRLSAERHLDGIGELGGWPGCRTPRGPSVVGTLVHPTVACGIMLNSRGAGRETSPPRVRCAGVLKQPATNIASTRAGMRRERPMNTTDFEGTELITRNVCSGQNRFGS